MAETEENQNEPETPEESVVEEVEETAERWALKLKPRLAKLFRKRDRQPDNGAQMDSTD
jgi:hypothetical protein